MPHRTRRADRIVETASGRDPEAPADDWVRIGQAIARSGLYGHLGITDSQARDRTSEALSADPTP